MIYKLDNTEINITILGLEFFIAGILLQLKTTTKSI